MEELEETGRLPDRRDRALFNAILYGVLRWRGRLDWLIAAFSKKPLSKIDAPILNILRVGLFQILFMTRIPTSAAVNTSVQLAKSMAAPWAGAFVNAILRRAATDHASVEFPDPQKHPVDSLAAAWGFPEWLAQRWLERYGAELAAALCESINRIPPLIVRTNTLKTSRSDLMAAIQPEAAEVAATTDAPDGVRVSGLRRRLDKPGQLPARLVSRPG